MDTQDSSNWKTVDVPTHPIKGGRWVAVIERIRKNATGEIREHHSHSPLHDGEAHPGTWIWTDGNYSCDCNRALFFGYAVGETYEDVDHPCGDGDYSVDLVNPVTGEVFFSELAVKPPA